MKIESKAHGLKVKPQSVAKSAPTNNIPNKNSYVSSYQILRYCSASILEALYVAGIKKEAVDSMMQ